MRDLSASDARFIFFGSPQFAATVLEELLASSFSPSCVVCNPDRPVGRKKVFTPPPVKILAEGHHIPVLQPETLTDSETLLMDCRSELFVVAAYAKIIPTKVLSSPRYGAIGVHPSLLPKYRGASPIQTAILNGETETGITLFKMDEKVDHGPIIAQEKVKIGPRETSAQLAGRLAVLGGKLLARTLPDVFAEKTDSREQDETQATMTRKFRTEDGFVSSELLREAQEKGGEKACEILNAIRALGSEPGVWTVENKKRAKLLDADLNEDGRLRLLCIQYEGKKPIRIR